jgi:predicted transcriptional regulator
MRTVIDVPDALIESLDQVGALEQRSRAALIREAITQYLKVKSIPAADEAFGLWKKRAVDGVQYQRSLRDEWGNR